MHLSWDQLRTVTGGTLHVGRTAEGEAPRIERVVIDSREVQPGDLFWTLQGSRCHGAQFAVDALARGAAGVVVPRGAAPLDAPGCKLEVDDTLAALWQVAAAQRAQFRGTVIGVTGSVGKSTARHMIDTLLSADLRGVASHGNRNNQIGLPWSMLALDDRSDYAVFELGASARGEIAQLASLCRPTIGVITAVADAHLGGFGSLEAVAQAKAELLQALASGGNAVLNGDCPRLRRLGSLLGNRATWFGRGADCEVRATQVEATDGCLSFHVDGQRFSIPVWGRHLLASALAAIAVGRLLGLSHREMAMALASFESLPMRCDVKQVGSLLLIDDSYNACPAAMRAALELLRDMSRPGRRVVVCGDMRELGADAPRLHREVGRQVVTVCGADLLVACGSMAAHVVEGARAAGMPAARSIASADAATGWFELRARLLDGDVVLVKGSRALGMEQISRQIEQQGALVWRDERMNQEDIMAPAVPRPVLSN